MRTKNIIVSFIRIFITGMFISFLGTIPMGTLNISAMQISVSDGVRPALYFSIGALLVEILYVRLTLVAMNWFRSHKKLLKGMEWATLLIIFLLAASSFYAAMHTSVKISPVLSSTVHRFWLGAGLSAINPLQVPFWFGWSTILFNKNILVPRENVFISYMAGIGMGTLAGLCLFIFGGKFLFERMNTRQDIVNWIIGFIFLVTAVFLFIKMLMHKDPISEMTEENPS
jgi:threonine/homoserine/homoserine lactone efflux protein